MKVYFVVSPFGSGRQKIFKTLLGSLKKVPDTKTVGDGIGGVAGSEEIGGLDNITLSLCLYQLEHSFSIFEDKDNYVFTGTGLSMYIKEILPHYPNAGLYLIRRTSVEDELNESNIESLSSKFKVDQSWIVENNTRVRTNLNSIATELNLEWRPINSPAFTIGNTPNWADSAATATSSLEMAVYNL